jgi:hypothetical protein
MMPRYRPSRRRSTWIKYCDAREVLVSAANDSLAQLDHVAAIVVLSQALKGSCGGGDTYKPEILLCENFVQPLVQETSKRRINTMK